MLGLSVLMYSVHSEDLFLMKVGLTYSFVAAVAGSEVKSSCTCSFGNEDTDEYRFLLSLPHIIKDCLTHSGDILVCLPHYITVHSSPYSIFLDCLLLHLPKFLFLKAIKTNSSLYNGSYI